MGIRTKAFGAVAAVTIVVAGVIGATGIVSAQEPQNFAAEPGRLCGWIRCSAVATRGRSSRG